MGLYPREIVKSIRAAIYTYIHMYIYIYIYIYAALINITVYIYTHTHMFNSNSNTALVPGLDRINYLVVLLADICRIICPTWLG